MEANKANEPIPEPELAPEPTAPEPAAPQTDMEGEWR